METGKKYYTIQVGMYEPQEIEVGHINKDTGLPKGQTEKALAVLGVVAIPNFSRVWGKRDLDKEKKPTGKVTFMEWGEEGGEVIEVRYLRSSSSIDKQYQEKSGIKASGDGGETEIILNTGLNDFDSKTEAPLIQMLKVHTFNGSSVCRNPENRHVVFEEYDANKVASKVLKEDEFLFEAMSKIMTIKDNTKKLRVFAELFFVDPAKQDKVILNELMVILKKQPQKFLERIEFFKKDVQDVLVKANDFELMNFASPGEIIVSINGVRPIKVENKTSTDEKEKLEYVIESCLEPEMFDTITKLKQGIADKVAQLS